MRDKSPFSAVPKSQMPTTTSVLFSGSFLSLGTGAGTAGGSLLFLSFRPVTRGGARGAFTPPPTGSKGPHLDTQYPS